MMRTALDPPPRFAWSSTPTTSECRRRSRAASCARTATGIVTSTSRARQLRRLRRGARDPGRGARAWAWACTWRWSVAVPSRTPPRVPSLLTAGGPLSRARRRVHRRLDEAGRSTPATSSASSTRRSRACATRASRSITWTRTTTSGFSRVVGRSVEAVARQHGIERHPQRDRDADAVVGHRPAARAQGRRADRPRLADAPPARAPAATARRAGATSNRVASTRCASWRSSGASARARTSSSATRARRARTFYDHTGELRCADVAEGAPRARTARHHASADGEICFERRALTRRARRRRRAPPEPYVSPQDQPGRADRQGDRAGHRVRRDLRRRDRLPRAEGGADGVGVDPDRGAGDLGVQAARLVDDPREQHRPDDRLGGRIDRRRRRVHPARLPVSGRRRPRARRRRAVLLVLDDPDAGDGRRRARRADDDPAAARR